MKKIIFVFCVIFFLLSLTSCKNNETVINGFSMDAPYSLKIKNKDGINESEIREILKKCDSIFDAYDDNSELGKLNKNKKISLSENNGMLFDIIRNTLPYCDEFFDISLRNVTVLWDFNSDKSDIPEKSDIKNALKTVGYENIVFNDNLIELKNAGSIELGAVAKGYAADVIYFSLLDNEAIIDIGGTVKSSVSDKIKVGVKNPEGEGMLLAFYLKSGEAVSTSGSYERYIEKDGVRYSHILNPKTGYGIDNGLLSVTVVSDSALKSDILSTKYFLNPYDAINSDINIKVIFVTKDKKVYIKGDLEVSDIDIDYKLQEN